MIPQGEGLRTCGILYRWFADVSGLGLAEQARISMHPDPTKKDEELAKNVELWQGEMRRLEDHAGEYKLVPMYEISALRMLMTGKADEYFDLWDADRDHTDVVWRSRTRSYRAMSRTRTTPASGSWIVSPRRRSSMEGIPWTSEQMVRGAGGEVGEYVFEVVYALAYKFKGENT